MSGPKGARRPEGGRGRPPARRDKPPAGRHARRPPSRSRRGPSQILQEFIQPLLVEAGRPTEGQLEGALRIAVTIWNGVVLADGKRSRRPLTEARAKVEATGDRALLRLFDVLVDRKRRKFANERWLVDGFEVVSEDDRMMVRVDRRFLPPSSPRRQGKQGGR